MGTIRHRGAAATCIALACALALAGCASPYVTNSPPSTTVQYAPATLSYALAYSRSQHDLYRAKVVELGDSERILSNGLITLGGALVWLAAAGGHPHAVRNLTVGGGTAYTLGVFNNDKRRAVIYVAGMRALECANDVVAPLNLPDPVVGNLTQQRTSLDTLGDTVASNMATVTKQMMLVGQQVPAAETSLAAARDSLAAAQQATDRATQAGVAADALLARQGKAGELLMNAVARIDALVLDDLRGTEGSIQAVPGILTDLAKNAAMFGALAQPPQPASTDTTTTAEGPHGREVRAQESTQTRGADTKNALNALADAVANLKKSSAQLDARAQRLSGVVGEIQQGVQLDRLKSCNVEGVVTTMSVTPQVLTFTEKTADTQMIVVRGGKLDYSAGFTQSTHPGIDIQARSPFLRSDVIAVESKADLGATPASYQIMVRDASDQVQFVTVKIQPASGGSTPPAGDGGASANADLGKSEIRKRSPLQVASGATVIFKSVDAADGNYTVTYEAQGGAKVAHDEVEKALANDTELVNAIGKDAKIAAIDASGAAESPHARTVRSHGVAAASLTREQVSAIQRNLCMDEASIDGRWGMRTQAALLRDRKRRKDAGDKDVPQGLLKNAEAAQILARTQTETARICGH